MYSILLPASSSHGEPAASCDQLQGLHSSDDYNSPHSGMCSRHGTGMLTKNQKCLLRCRPALQSELSTYLLQAMDLDLLEKKYKASMAEAFNALLNADEDKKPLYYEAWKS